MGAHFISSAFKKKMEEKKKRMIIDRARGKREQTVEIDWTSTPSTGAAAAARYPRETRFRRIIDFFARRHPLAPIHAGICA